MIDQKEQKPDFPRFTKQDLFDVYSAGVLQGIAQANGTTDKLMSPEKYFKTNFDIDIFKKGKELDINL